MRQHMDELGDKCQVFTDIDEIVSTVKSLHQHGDHIVLMSNGGFGGIHKKLIELFSHE